VKPLRYLRRGSRGQAMVLGAVALLCLTLGVLATLNLGQAVHEKVKLQNTADAAAYSLATMEARTFNYIAFTNRVQITHYHTAMVVQSYLSYAGYSLAVFGTAADILRALYKANDNWCNIMVYPPLRAVYCAAKAITGAFSTFIDRWLQVADMFYQIAHTLEGYFVEAMSLYNRDAMHRRIQLMKAAQLNVHLLTGMQEFVKINDNQLQWFDTSNMFNMLLNTVMNSFEYWSAYDKAAGMNPAAIGLLFAVSDLGKYHMKADDTAVKEAQGVMAEITNATRSHKDVYDRSGTAFATTGFSYVTGQKKGQTRLISKDTGSIDPKPEIAGIRGNKHYADCTGDRLASDDFVASGTAFGVGGLVFTAPYSVANKLGDGIRTDGDGGKHYKYKVGTGYQGLSTMYTILPPADGPKPTTTDIFETEERKHKYTGKPYLAPYFAFKPYAGSDKNISGPDLKARDYNQPSTWMYLNKKPKDFQTESNQKPWQQKFSITGPTRGNFVRSGSAGDNNNLTFQAKGSNTVSLDTTIGGERQAFLDFMQGLNVLSRGQVYYHRPDDWREQPNFFNPFWRARLAPIAQVLTNLWERLVGNNLVPGPEASLLQQMLQNLLNNALADFFLRTVTGLITH
jgi:hypothetical protein